MERILNMHKVLCLRSKELSSPSCHDCIKGERNWRSLALANNYTSCWKRAFFGKSIEPEVDLAGGIDCFIIQSNRRIRRIYPECLSICL